ncbi:GrpB family protein [Rhizobium ruizarguesonis]|uniref:GrpB family protein n=1 Tax=Rhizobium ruizarguesonis TaxID=2081791 RepID=UPI0010325BB2|nr:GrpB family protein [Rhizobium ruizarguesonis]TAU57450.1 GrpB family protein [Rhizobium ruizarguesonis]
MATLVEILPYDPSWPRHFSTISSELRQLLGNTVVAIDHIGSTSVPGLSAKPLIDIDVTVNGLADIPAASATMIEAGYDPRGNRYGDDVWAFLQSGSTPKQRVYLCPPDNETHRRRLVFRDYLRNHDDMTAAYARLKERLAKQFPYDGDRYTAEKSGFINDVIERARSTGCF